MNNAAQIICALAVDAMCGDPRWLPHPVRLMGSAALALEPPLRRGIANPRLAGVAVVILVVGGSAVTAALLLTAATAIHPLVGDTVAVLLLYTCFAARDLSDHARAVLRPLRHGDLVTARARVALLVGRDTASLDEAEITRATVESVAENSVDGVIAPLLFAFGGGAVAAVVYKAINTLDSTFGYKNERYRHFGWASARLDDAANYLPARLGALLMVVAAWLLRLDCRRAWQVMWRDHANHPSPNGGWSEAACAGALRIRLGGENSYFGRKSRRPYMGDAMEPLQAHHIEAAVRLMWVTTALMTATALAIAW